MTLDFASNVDYVWALLPEIVLAVTAMVVLLVGVHDADSDGPGGDSPDRVGMLGWISLVGILVAGAFNGWLYGVEVVGEGGVIAVDAFRLFANWIFLLGAGLTLLIAGPYVVRQRLQAGEFHALVLLATVGTMIMGGTRHLILLFLALETMSISAYILTAYNRRDRRSAEGGLKYFLMGAFSSGFLLYGIALVWGATGSVDLSGIAATIEGGGGFAGLLLAGMGLLAIGFAFKVGAVPFHMWTPDAYEGAPSPSTAFMAAAVKAASFAAFLRVFLEAFPALYDAWFPVLWWLAALTMVVANLIALSQPNVKRMLAYSSVAHGGYLLVGLAAGTELAAAGVLFYLLVYTLMTVGAFAILMIVAGQGEDRLQIDDYAGFGGVQPVLAVLLTIFLLSLAGFPGTGGFMAKIYLLQGAAESELWVLALILVVATVASYYYYLRVAWYMWMKTAPDEERKRSFGVPLPMRATLLVVAAAILYLGVFPGGLLEAARVATEGMGVPGIRELLGGAP